MSLTPSSIVDTYNAAGSFTWVKRLGAKKIQVSLMASGGGGANGNCIATAPTGGQGGQGAASGAFACMELPADMVGNTETVVVGAGGIGRPGINVTGATGGQVSGNISRFGNFLYADSQAVLSSGIFATQANQNLGANPANGGNNNANGFDSPLAGGGGGGGGNLTVTTGAANAGGVGGRLTGVPGAAGHAGYFGVLAGGAAGAINSNGSDGNSLGLTSVYGGSGGGGGGSSVAGKAGNGGKGGFPGGGGGGGGCSVNGQFSGDGGNGADGIVVVTTYF